MNTPDVYGTIGGALVLGAGFLAAIWHGVIVVTFSFGVKVVPPWQRKAPAPKAQAAPRSTAGAAVGEAAAPAGPTPVRDQEPAAA